MFYTFEKARPFRISFESITTNQHARIRHFILKNQMLTGSPILPVKDKFKEGKGFPQDTSRIFLKS